MVDGSGEPVPPLLLALDLAGTFAFGLNGALTAVRATRLDVVGVVTLAMMTALGGGVIRDVLIGANPAATFEDWRYFALAAAGGLIAVALSRRLVRLEKAITVLDAIGLSVFAVFGASKALEYGLGIAPAALLGVVTGVGGIRAGTGIWRLGRGYCRAPRRFCAADVHSVNQLWS